MSVTAGTPYTLNLSQTSGDSVTSWTINWGDGSAPQVVSGDPASVSYTYMFGDTIASAWNYAITATATNDQGTFASVGAQGVQVSPAAPTVVISGAASVLSGTAYTLDLSADETDGDAVSEWVVDWGDGSTDTLVDGETSDTHVYAASSSTTDYNITATATDSGGTWDSNAQPVEVDPSVTRVSATGSGSVAAGATYTLSLGQTVGDTLSGWTIDWGDGSTDTADGDATSFTHVFADSDSPGPAIYSIVATASNDEGDFVAIPVNVAVTPAPPTISISGAGSVTQGAVYTLDLSDVEPGANTVTGWTIDWGDGDTDTLTADAPSITHVYATATTGGAYDQITASATDTGGSDPYAATPIDVTVSAAGGPTTLGIAAAGGATTVAEGAPYTLDLSQSAGDPLANWNINWGDGTTSTVAGGAASAQHVYDDAWSPGPWDYSITATGDNDQGTFAAAAPVAMAVTAVAPTLGISGASTVDEGATYTLDLSAIEPAGAIASGVGVSSWTINWGDGSTSTLLGAVSSASHVFVTSPVGDSTTYTITATATDDSGTTSAGSQSVTVSPVATPTFTLSGAGAANAGDTYTLTLMQTTGIPLAGWTVNWGDGTAPEQLPAGDTSVTHVYGPGATTTGPNIYTITATGVTAQGAPVSGPSASVTISPIAPTATFSGDDSETAGTAYTLDLAVDQTFSDPATDWLIDWGDGSAVEDVAGTATSATHTYPDTLTDYAITASVLNADGTYAAEDTDVDGSSLTVTGVDGPPTATSVSPVTIDEDSTSQSVLDLTTVFSDAIDMSSALVYSVIDNSDSSILASATIVGDELVVSAQPNVYGYSEVTVEALNSSGQTTDQTIPVIVQPVNQAPTLATDSSGAVINIPDQTITSSSQPTLVDLWNYFTDREDGSYLTYTVNIVSDPDDIFGATPPSVDANDFLNLDATANGAAVLTVTATDSGGLSITSAAFNVTATGCGVGLQILDKMAPSLGESETGVDIPTGPGIASDIGYMDVQRSGGDDAAAMTVPYQLYYQVGDILSDTIDGSLTFSAGQTVARVNVSDAPVDGLPDDQAASGTIELSFLGAFSTSGGGGVPILGNPAGTIVQPAPEPDNDYLGTTAGQPAHVRFERYGDVADALSFNYTVTGAFVPVGMSASGTLTFPAGYNSIDIPIVAPAGESGYVVINSDEAIIQSVAANDDTVSLSFPGVDTTTQHNAGVYMSENDGYGYGNTAPETVQVDGDSVVEQQPVADNAPDRGLVERLNPSIGQSQSATVTLTDSSGSPQTGTLSWDIPDGFTVWWKGAFGQYDRWVQVSSVTLTLSGTLNIPVEIEGMSAGAGALTATFEPTGESGNDVSDYGDITDIADDWSLQDLDPTAGWVDVAANQAVWDTDSLQWTPDIAPQSGLPSVTEIEWMAEPWTGTNEAGADAVEFAETDSVTAATGSPGAGDWAVYPVVYFANGAVAYGKFEERLIENVKSIEWVGIPGGQVADVNNPQIGDGEDNLTGEPGGPATFYAEANQPAGTRDANGKLLSEVHNQVYVEVTLSVPLKIGMTLDMTVMLYDPVNSLDVGTGSPDDNLNSSAASGNGLGAALSYGQASGVSVTVPLKADGQTTVYDTVMTVDSPQPGNNYIAAAGGKTVLGLNWSTDNTYLLNPNAVIPTKWPAQSATLTIWRHLNVTTASMAAPTIQQLVGSGDVIRSGKATGNKGDKKVIVTATLRDPKLFDGGQITIACADGSLETYDINEVPQLTNDEWTLTLADPLPAQALYFLYLRSFDSSNAATTTPDLSLATKLFTTADVTVVAHAASQTVPFIADPTLKQLNAAAAPFVAKTGNTASYWSTFQFIAFRQRGARNTTLDELGISVKSRFGTSGYSVVYSQTIQAQYGDPIGALSKLTPEAFYFAETSAHELGHAFGLADPIPKNANSPDGSIMTYVAVAHAISDADQANIGFSRAGIKKIQATLIPYLQKK